MHDDDDSGVRPGSPLDLLCREDLSPLSQYELAARITALEGEIERAKAAAADKSAGRNAAEALFR